MYTTAKCVIVARNSSRDKAWQNEIMNYVGARYNRYAVPRETRCNRRKSEWEGERQRAHSKEVQVEATMRIVLAG